MPRMALLFAGLIAMICVLSSEALAQSPAPNDSIKQETAAPAAPLPGLDGGYYADQPIDSTPSQNPTVALFKSILVPGWGQIGNRKYIKAGVVMAVEGILIYKLVDYVGQASDARKLFDAAVDIAERDTLYTKYKRLKDDRNFYSWMTGLTIFISMFDAYVDAHLARFPKYKKGLSLEMYQMKPDAITARLCYNF